MNPKLVQCCGLVAMLVITLTGCAASPEDIKPLNISTSQYANLNCDQLASFKVTLTNAYNKAADEEDSARALDSAQLITLGLPLGSMTHESVPWQIADLKGRILAVEKLQIQYNCTSRQALSE